MRLPVDTTTCDESSSNSEDADLGNPMTEHIEQRGLWYTTFEHTRIVRKHQSRCCVKIVLGCLVEIIGRIRAFDPS